MNFKKPLLYCNHCKKVTDNLDDLLFVESNSSHGFCSERCIEDFYSPLADYFADMEKRVRGELSIKNESVLSYAGEPKNMEKLIQRPDEIWKLKGPLGEELYSYISHQEDDEENPFYLVMLCFVYNKRPSYILLATATQSDSLLLQFRIGEQLEEIDEFVEQIEASGGKSLQISDEMIALMESKKSGLLAELMENRKDSDIPFEHFGLYEAYYTPTLETPDEIYKLEDDEGDELYIYIKAHDRDGTSFYYFVICVGGDSAEVVGGKTLLPVISFPTLDPDLYRIYRRGELLSGALRN